jgi:zinc protease
MKPLCLLLLGSLQALAIAAGSPFERIKESGGIEEYRLKSNDLSVLLLEDHTAPVVTFMVTYHVGSRNEVTGTTGATHLLEHMMFKGTARYNQNNGNSYATMLSRYGAEINATTSYDRTDYFATVPSERLDLVAELEADRMHDLSLREEDRRAEMVVVRNEYERGENSPVSALTKEIFAAAFEAHPYHHPVIGWRSDIEKVPIEKLQEFYRTFYWPNNATVTVVGDFTKDHALEAINRFFSPISRSPKPIPVLYTEEPEQQGPRRVILERAGQLGVVTIGFKSPEGLSSDCYALSVLSTILQSGKSSRLYQGLTDKGLTTSASASLYQLRDPGMFLLAGFLAPGIQHEQVEKALLAEIEKIQKEGVRPEEVQRAINEVEAETVYTRDGPFNVAENLNEAIAIGDWTYFTTYLDKIKQVTSQQVQEIARKYLTTDKGTTGYFVPNKPGPAARPQDLNSAPTKLYYRDGPPQGQEATPSGKVRAPAFAKASAGRPGRPESTTQVAGHAVEASQERDPTAGVQISDRIQRTKIAGIDLIVFPTKVKGFLTLVGALPAGRVFDSPELPGVASLTASMLDEGTLKHNKFEISDLLASHGAKLQFRPGEESILITGQCLTKDTALFIDLLAEQLREPAFPAEELEKVKTQAVAAFQHAMDEPSSMASVELSQKLFPPGHPNYHRSYKEMVDAIRKPTVNDLRKFHQSVYGPHSCTLIAVGDIDTAQLQAAIEKGFSGWQGGTDYKRDFPPVASAGAKEPAVLFIPEKTSVAYMRGLPVNVRPTSPESIPLAVANQIFGGPTFTSRLMATVRDREGLTYGIGSTISGDTFTEGSMTIRATFAPSLLDRGMVSVDQQLKTYLEKGPTEDELSYHKQFLIGNYKISLATTEGIASKILSTIQQELPLSFLDQYPVKVGSVTLEQANAVFRKYIKPEEMTTVIAGTVQNH